MGWLVVRLWVICRERVREKVGARVVMVMVRVSMRGVWVMGVEWRDWTIWLILMVVGDMLILSSLSGVVRLWYDYGCPTLMILNEFPFRLVF
jgi:hypothetical protein